LLFVKAIPITLTLIGLSIFVTIATWLGTIEATTRLVQVSSFGYSLLEIGNGEVWRLLTPAFLHFTVMHIVFNMLWLWDLGRKIEQALGSWMLLLFFVVAASTSNLAQFVASGPFFGGMSGVVYGLLGFVWMQSRYNPFFLYYLEKWIVWMMLIWYMVCLTGLVGNIANTAHTVGLVVGVIWGRCHAAGKRRRLRVKRFSND